jgi:hypothetical protein
MGKHPRMNEKPRSEKRGKKEGKKHTHTHTTNGGNIQGWMKNQIREVKTSKDH